MTVRGVCVAADRPQGIKKGNPRIERFGDFFVRRATKNEKEVKDKRQNELKTKKSKLES